MEERPTELQQSALAAEPAGWAVCEWAAGLWGRGRSVDGQAGGPAPLAQSSGSNARTSRSEYVSGAAGSRFLPRTERAPGAWDPSSARSGPCPREPRPPAPLPPESSGVEPSSAPILLDRSVQIPAGPTCRHLPGARVGRHLGYGAARLLCARSLPGSLGLCESRLSRAPPAPPARPGSAPRAPRAMARAGPPPGLLPLLAPLLLPLLLPTGCWALEGEWRRGPARCGGASSCGLAG